MAKTRQVREPNHMWKKEEVRKLYDIWDAYNIDEMAEELGVSRKQVAYMATTMWKYGINLPKKSRRGYLQSMLTEVRDELKLGKKASKR